MDAKSVCGRFWSWLRAEVRKIWLRKIEPTFHPRTQFQCELASSKGTIELRTGLTIEMPVA